MARLTFDAIAIQSVLGAGERVTILEAAQRAFCPDQTTISQVAILRTRRACHVLKERGLLDVDEEKGVSLRAADNNGAAALQLSAVIARTILAARDEETEEEPGSGPD